MEIKNNRHKTTVEVFDKDAELLERLVNVYGFSIVGVLRLGMTTAMMLDCNPRDAEKTLIDLLGKGYENENMS